MQMADEAGLDLVEISPNATPPVCKIMDFGKFKYETQSARPRPAKSRKSSRLKRLSFDQTPISMTTT